MVFADVQGIYFIFSGEAGDNIFLDSDDILIYPGETGQESCWVLLVTPIRLLELLLDRVRNGFGYLGTIVFDDPGVGLCRLELRCSTPFSSFLNKADNYSLELYENDIDDY
jgi:hypothetical protein